MKNILFTLILLFTFTNTSFSQDWKNVPVPIDLVTYSSTNFQYQVDSLGKIYCIYSYTDGSNNILKVDQFDALTQSWLNKWNETLTQAADEIQVDFKDHIIYFSFVSEQTPNPIFNVYQIINETVFHQVQTINANYKQYSQYDFKVGGANKYFWFTAHSNTTDFSLSTFNIGTGTIDTYIIPQFNLQTPSNLEMEQVGDTLWFAAGDTSNRLILVKSHFSAISFNTFDGSAAGIFNDAGNTILGDRTILLSNRVDELSFISTNSVNNRVEYNFTNGALSTASNSGEYYPYPQSTAKSYDNQSAYLLGNFDKYGDFTNLRSKVLKKNFATDVWDTIGVPGNQVFTQNNSAFTNMTLGFSPLTNRFVAGYDSANYYAKKLKVYNVAPDLGSKVVNLNVTLCTNTASVKLFSEFSLFDENKDFLKIVDVLSSDASVINPSNITFSSSQVFKRTFFDVYYSNGTPGNVTLSFNVTDGFDTVAVSVNVTVADYVITSVTNASGCSNSSLTLDANVVSGDLRWFTDPTGGTTFQVGGPFVTGVITSTVLYYVEGVDNNSTCVTPRLLVTGTILALPTVFAGNDTTLCENSIITLTGTGAPTLTWSGGITNGVAFNISGGTQTQTVTGTDANGCQNTDDIVITLNALPFIDAGIDQTICENTSITLVGGGGNTYSWDNGISNGVSFTPAVGTTTFTLTGTDLNGCQNTDLVDVIVNALPIISAVNDTTLCENTSFTLYGSGGNTYSWDNGISDGVSFTPAVGTTTYTVTGTDLNGCQNTDLVNIIVNALPVISAGNDTTLCENTSITLVGSGSNTYSWDNGISDGVSFIPVVGTTTYTVIGFDLNGCQNTDQVDIIVNALPIIDAGIDQTVCENTSITLNGSGANTYSWDNGISNGISFTPAVGTTTFTVTGTDLNGCQNTDLVDVIVNALPTISAGNDTILCENTSFTLYGSGGNTYSWNNGISDGVSFTPAVGTTTYTVTGTDLNGCQNTDLVNITVNALPVISAGSDTTLCENTAITLVGSGANTYSWDNGISDGVSFIPIVGTTTYTVTGFDLNGCQNTDQVDIIVNALPIIDAGIDQTVCENTSITLNGSGANTYSWDNGISNGVSFTPAVGTTTFTVTGTDLNGCQNTDLVDVIVNALPTISAGNDTTYCENTSITLYGSGGNTYSWDNGISDGVSFTPAVGTTTYTVTGTDLNGCQNTDLINITVNALPIISAGNDTTLCENTSIVLAGSGGNTYSWDNGISNGVSFTPIVGTTSYTVTGSDLNGCQNTDQLNIIVNALPSVFAGTDITVCENDLVTNSAFGALTYTWDNGITDNVPFNAVVGTTTYTVSGTDANGCVGTDSKDIIVNPAANIGAGLDQVVCENTLITLSSTGAQFLAWDNGVFDNTSFFQAVGTITYTLNGTDFNGCPGSDQVDVTVLPLPLVNAGVDQSICENTSITLNGSGANSYSWDNGISDGISFTPVIGTTTFTLTGTDANGCQNTDQVDITVNALPLVNAGSGDFNTCTGSFVTLNATGASTYIWNVGVINPGAYQLINPTTFIVTGTDVNGCTNTASFFVDSLPLPIVDAGIDQSYCQNGTVILNGSGANTYVWNNGVLDGVGFSPSGNQTYTVTGTDGNGCYNTDQITLTEITLPTINTNDTIEICENEEIYLNASSNSQFIFWYDQNVAGNIITSGSEYFSNEIFSDSIIYVGAIENGCSSGLIPVQITVNSKPSITLNATNSDCGLTNGTASAIINQGTSPFTYYWSTGEQQVLNVANLGTGLYYFNVEDSKGCKALEATEINPSSISIVPTIVNPTCFDGNNGSINLSITGVTGNIAYFWSTGQQSPSIANLRAGTYEVNLTSETGCTFSADFQLTEPGEIANIVTEIKPSCGNIDGQLEVTETLGGVSPYNFTWSNGANGITNNAIGFGVYTLTTTDNVGCQNFKTFYLSESNAPSVVGSVTEASCNTNNGAIDVELTPQIGDTVTSISWSNGAITEDISSIGQGNFVCTATTTNGCSAIRGWNLNGMKPLTQEICIVSVDSVTTTNLVIWEKVQTTGVAYYNIYRESNQIDDYLLIDTVQYTNLSVFNDVVASPNARSWRYKISAVDACGVEGDLSAPHKTLHLNTFDLGATGINVTWDQYEGTVFSSYILWRYTNEFGWENIANLPTNSLSYTDDFDILAPGLDYMVEIALDIPCTATVWRAQDFDRSRSNKEKGVFNPGEGTGEFSNNSIFEQNGEDATLKVYPNPFNDIIQLELINLNDSQNSVNIQVYNVDGKLMLENTYFEGINSINLATLVKGIYFIKYKIGSETKTIKIIKN